MAEMTKIPDKIKNNFIRKEVCRDQIISYGKNGKIGYLVNGEVQSVRYQEGEKFIFPKYLEKGEFLGMFNILLDDDIDFELETREDSIIIEIPVKIFKKYILSEPAIEIKLLKKINLYLLESTRSFFIRSHGGTRAYMAYLLYTLSERGNIIRLKKYSELENVVFSSRTMTYKTLKGFEEKRILRKESKTFIIERRELLKEYFEKYVN